MRLPSLVASALSGLLVFGCQSYEIVQSNIYLDDAGNVVRIDYGRSDSDHVNTYRNPKNGQEMDFKSRYVIDVTLPDGDDFTAWQCMNFAHRGTMYKSDDEDWIVQTDGTSCGIFRHKPIPTDPGFYVEIYRSLIGESLKSDYEPDPKWRKLTKGADGKWK